MLTPTELHSVADKLAKPADGPLFVWITGLAAAGKSFVLEHLANNLANRGKIATFSDCAELVAEIDQDTDRRYHIRSGQNFVVTDPELDDLILRRLVDRADKFKGDYCNYSA